MNKSTSSILTVAMALFPLAAIAKNVQTSNPTSSNRSAVGNIRVVEKNVNRVSYRNYSINHNDYSIHN